MTQYAGKQKQQQTNTHIHTHAHTHTHIYIYIYMYVYIYTYIKCIVRHYPILGVEIPGNVVWYLLYGVFYTMVSPAQYDFTLKFSQNASLGDPCVQ